MRLDVFDNALLQKPLHLSAVNRIAREAINLPTNYSLRFASLDSRHHVAEYWAAWRFCTFLLDKLLGNFQFIAPCKRAQFQKLRFNRQNLFVFNVS